MSGGIHTWLRLKTKALDYLDQLLTLHGCVLCELGFEFLVLLSRNGP